MAAAEDKRTLILQAAVRVFAAEGYEATRVGDIAKEAGVAYGLVYHYFGSKDAVLEAVFREQWGRLLAALALAEGDGGRRGGAARARGEDRAPLLAGRSRPRAPARPRDHAQPAHPGRARRDRPGVRDLPAGDRTRAGRRGRSAPTLDPQLAAWMLYGALEEVLTGWVLGQLPDDADGGRGRRARGDRHARRRAASFLTARSTEALAPAPGQAGLCGLPLVRRRAAHAGAGELAGVDVAIVGAPTDDLVSDRPGTRFAPRAIRSASCPPGPHLEAGIDAFAELHIVDYGDAPVLPADPVASQAAIERIVGEVVAAGAVPVTLGGDHSITEACVAAIAARRGPVGLLHFDTHTDTGREVFGIEVSHGTPMYRLVEAGRVTGERYAQIGLRGYWPGPTEFDWQREPGIASFFMHDVRELGIEEVVARALTHVAEDPSTRRSTSTCSTRPMRRHGNAGTGRHDVGRPAVGGAHDRCVGRAGRCRRGGGAADGDRLGGHHRARRRADRARGAHRPLASVTGAGGRF